MPQQEASRCHRLHNPPPPHAAPLPPLVAPRLPFVMCRADAALEYLAGAPLPFVRPPRPPPPLAPRLPSRRSWSRTASLTPWPSKKSAQRCTYQRCPHHSPPLPLPPECWRRGRRRKQRQNAQLQTRFAPLLPPPHMLKKVSSPSFRLISPAYLRAAALRASFTSCLLGEEGAHERDHRQGERAEGARGASRLLASPSHCSQLTNAPPRQLWRGAMR